MTKQEVDNNIDSNIKTNGNNEIAAMVLNPVLKIIVNWVDENLGSLENLDTDNKTLVGAINELKDAISTRTDILTGEDNPNTTPPASFGLADYFNQVNKEGGTIALWQYNGIEWVLIN